MGAGRWAVTLLLAAAFARGLLWQASLPAWEGPDESTHFSYVQSLAENRRIPAFGTDSFSAEVYDSMRQTQFSETDWLSQRRFAAGTDGPGEFDRVVSTPAHRQAGATNRAGAYAPVYYLLAVPFYYLGRPLGVLGSLFAVRLFDVLLGVLAVYLTILAGRALWPSQPGLALVAGGLLAFQPMFDQGTTMVNSDAGAYAAGAALIAVATAALRHPPRWTWGLAIGAIAGLGFVVKPTFALVGFGLLAFVVLRAGGHGVSATAREGAGMLLGGLATAGWWIALSYATRSGLLAQIASGSGTPRSLDAYLRLLVAGRFHYLFRAWVDWLWGDFAWLNTPLPMGVYLGIEGLVAILLAGLVVSFARRLRRPDGLAAEPLPAQVVFLATAVLGGMLFLHLTDALLFIRTGEMLLQGRYLLVVGPALVLCLLVGGLGWVGTRLRGAAAMSLLGGAVALNVLSVGVLWQRFYT
jgi:4-amino-4-deoxy-L-arabinose transferase-like glycosyltransferase